MRSKYNVDHNAPGMWYKNFKYRSILEAKIAQTLDTNGLQIKYEYKKYEMYSKRGKQYRFTPDFSLTTMNPLLEAMTSGMDIPRGWLYPEIKLIVEAKGACDEDCQRKFKEYERHRLEHGFPLMFVASNPSIITWEPVPLYLKRIKKR